MKVVKTQFGYPIPWIWNMFIMPPICGKLSAHGGGTFLGLPPLGSTKWSLNVLSNCNMHAHMSDRFRLKNERWQPPTFVCSLHWFVRKALIHFSCEALWCWTAEQNWLTEALKNLLVKGIDKEWCNQWELEIISEIPSPPCTLKVNKTNLNLTCRKLLKNNIVLIKCKSQW